MSQIVVAAFYMFTPLDGLPGLKAELEAVCADAGILGTVILASEGINGTVAGSRAAIDALLGHIRGIPGADGLEHKESFADAPPFYRMKIRLKREIVTMGVEGIDPSALAGTYVEPQDWNALIADPEIVLIDTRNNYEARIGTFPGAIDPQTQSFSDFPGWFDRQTELHGKRKFAMFCTGGIRCEKATAFLRLRGFDEVYHLKGGILKYLETVPEAESRWQGECFIFDQRTTLAHGNTPGSYEICHGCRTPVSEADRASPHYVAGVSCPRCAEALSTDQKRRFAERQKQIALAERRGVPHIGARPAKRREG